MTQPLVRYTHVHAGLTLTAADGSTREAKGRLLATLASQEMPDGTVAVGVSRCSRKDTPSRFQGRAKAEARLNRLLRSFTADGVLPKQAEMFRKEQEDFLCFRVTQEHLVNNVIRGQIFRRLASDDTAERMRAIQELSGLRI